MTRRELVTSIAALEQTDRQTLHRLGVRLGPLDVFQPALLKPAAQQWRAVLQSVRANQPMPALPGAGSATLDVPEYEDSNPRRTDRPPRANWGTFFRGWARGVSSA